MTFGTPVTGDINLQTLNVHGIGGYADLYPILVEDGVQITETMQGASTVELTVIDKIDSSQFRKLLSSGVLAAGLQMSFLGAEYDLVQIGKRESLITLTFELSSVQALRSIIEPDKVPPDTMTRVQFCQRLIARAKGLTTTGPPGETKSLVELAQGTFDDDKSNQAVADQAENSWDAINRIMGEIGWRVFAVQNQIIIATDDWLLQNSAPVTLTEHQQGIDNIDFDWDIGKPAATATIDAWLGFSDLGIGSPVKFGGMGPASTVPWLVSEVHRSPFTKKTSVSLITTQHTKAEPDK